MTAPEMLARMRVYLDEKVEDFYDTDDLYQALTQAQAELANTIASNWHSVLRKQLMPVPIAIKALMKTQTGTLSGGIYFTCTDLLAPIVLKTGSSLATVHTELENDEVGAFLRGNLLLDQSTTYYRLANNFYLDHPESSAYSFTYTRVPAVINAGSDCWLTLPAQDAIISRALAIALADSEAELATAMMQVFQGQLQGLLK